MALSPDEKAKLAEITGESYAAVDTQAADINTATEGLLRADVERWDELRSKHVRLSGGRDGIDISPDREREIIRRRARKHLGLPLYSDEELSYAPDVMQLVEIDLGTNFG